MKTISFIIFYLFFYSASYAQEGINYNDQMLTRSLKRIGISDISSLTEMSEINKKQNNGRFFIIQNNAEYRYLYIGRVLSCRTEICNMNKNQNTEYFDYYILFNENQTIQNVKIFNYNATHGHEITAKSWLKQFIGFNASEKLQTYKNIDAISGATISVDAIIHDIQIRTLTLSSFQE